MLEETNFEQFEGQKKEENEELKLEVPKDDKEFEDIPSDSFRKIDRLVLGNIEGITKIRVYLGSDQTISNNSITKTQLDTEDYDNNSEFDSTTNYRFTVKKKGYYQVNAQISFNALGNDERIGLSIKKNGTTIIEQYNDYQQINISDTLFLEINDYIELFVYQLSGADATLKGLSRQTFMSIHKLS